MVRVLPGTYVPAGLTGDLSTRLRAIGRWNPRAVVLAGAAARVLFWPELHVEEIDVGWPRAAPDALGYRFHRRSIDPDHVVFVGGTRVASPALAAIDLVADLGGGAIDACLRSRAARLSELWGALKAHPGRPGNALVARLLNDSRDEPWSEAERLAHRLLRRHRITGWTANLAIRAGGRRYFGDVVFRAQRLVVEIDGRLHEDDPDVFEHDRSRQNALTLAGWKVLRFTYRMLVEMPEYVIATIRAALEAA